MKKISYILIFSLYTPPISTSLIAGEQTALNMNAPKSHSKDNNGNPQIIGAILAIAGLTSIGIFSFFYLRKKPIPSLPEKPSEPPQHSGKTRKQKLEDALAQTKALLRTLEKMENDLGRKKD